MVERDQPRIPFLNPSSVDLFIDLVEKIGWASPRFNQLPGKPIYFPQKRHL